MNLANGQLLIPPSDQARQMLAPVSETCHLDDERVNEIYARVVWSCLAEPGDRVAGELVRTHGAVDALGQAASRRTADPDLRAGQRRWEPRWSPRFARETLRVAAVKRLHLLTPDHPHWPVGADDLGEHAPLCLWVRGDTGVLQRLESSVAMVGARAVSSYGEHVTGELTAGVATRGMTVISGAAYGVDGVAHRAAIAASGTTIALLAGGADRAYPAGHTGLLDSIAAHGAVVSEVPCGTPPTRWRFLMRNRLIAAMSAATVVVEAGWRSGSLNTAGHAAALSRPLGAVPGPITSSTSAGCHRLLREYGAECVTSADDIAQLLGIVAEQGAALAGARTGDHTRVLDGLSTRISRSAEDVAQRAGMSVAEVEGYLGLFELEGVARRRDGGWRASAQGNVTGEEAIARPLGGSPT